VQVLAGVGVVNQLFKKSYAPSEDGINEDDKSAVELLLVSLNEALTVISRRLFSVIKGTLLREIYFVFPLIA
jgi:hypothetical protein